MLGMTDTTRPVRVPNVSPGARSGLSGDVIGSDAIAAYDENQSLASAGEPVTGYNVTPNQITDASTDEVVTPDGDAPAIPEDLTTVDDLLGWVRDADTPEDVEGRARAVLAAEQADGEGKDRKTLVEPLEALLAAPSDPQD